MARQTIADQQIPILARMAADQTGSLVGDIDSESAERALRSLSGFRETSPHLFANSEDDDAGTASLPFSSGVFMEALGHEFAPQDLAHQRRATTVIFAAQIASEALTKPQPTRWLESRIEQLWTSCSGVSDWDVMRMKRISIGIEGAPQVDESDRGDRSLLLGSIYALEMLETRPTELSEQGLRKRKHQFALSNLRLVISHVRGVERRGTLDFSDLIQEGFLGLLKALDKFDPYMGFTFSTYATQWIRQAVSRAIHDQGRTIRIPVHAGEELAGVERAAGRANIDVRYANSAEIYDALDEASRAATTPDRIRTLIWATQVPITFDIATVESAATGPDVQVKQSLGQISDVIRDSRALDPDTEAAHSMLVGAVKAMLGSLTDRERRVLQLRFGLEDGRARTLEEVGREFDVTRERIRQIEAKALRKLRLPSRRRKLAGWLDDGSGIVSESRARAARPPSLASPTRLSLHTSPWTLPRYSEVDLAELRRGTSVAIGEYVGRVCQIDKSHALATTTGWAIRANAQGFEPGCNCDSPGTTDGHLYAFIGRVPEEYQGIPPTGAYCAKCMRGVREPR